MLTIPGRIPSLLDTETQREFPTFIASKRNKLADINNVIPFTVLGFSAVATIGSAIYRILSGGSASEIAMGILTDDMLAVQAGLVVGGVATIVLLKREAQHSLNLIEAIFINTHGGDLCIG